MRSLSLLCAPPRRLLSFLSALAVPDSFVDTTSFVVRNACSPLRRTSPLHSHLSPASRDDERLGLLGEAATRVATHRRLQGEDDCKRRSRLLKYVVTGSQNETSQFEPASSSSAVSASS